MADYCSLADVKAWLSLGERDLGTRDDRILARLITSCSNFITSWCNRPFALGNYEEIRDGWGGERGYSLPLVVKPIRAILYLSIDGQPIGPAPSLNQPMTIDNAAGYAFNPNMLVVRGWRFTRGFQNIVVQYTGGFDPIPNDIQQACIEMVAHKYRQRTRIGERTKSLGGAESVTYETSLFSPKDIGDTAELLHSYKLIAPLAFPTPLEPEPEGFVLEDATPPVTSIEAEDETTPIVVEP